MDTLVLTDRRKCREGLKRAEGVNHGKREERELFIVIIRHYIKETGNKKTILLLNNIIDDIRYDI